MAIRNLKSKLIDFQATWDRLLFNTDTHLIKNSRQNDFHRLRLVG